MAKIKVCFATHNKHKVLEIRKLLAGKIEVLSLDDLGISEEIEESGDTLEENALLKAKYVYENYATPCFADDTGLEVEALDGAPGVFSARYAGEPPNNERNIDKLLSELSGKPNVEARFRTVIALVGENQEEFFEGIVDGEIIRQRRGTKGFGYDAVFLPKNFDRTFAEMDLVEKNKISHRARAVKKLIKFLQEK